MKEVFLGGTCASGTTWREELIPKLNINYFNPVVDDWDEAAQQLELEKRESCDYILYVITPRMEGVYSIAEVVDDSNKRPEQTIFCVLYEDGEDSPEWTPEQIKSMEAVKKLVDKNGALELDNLDEVADILNYINTLK